MKKLPKKPLTLSIKSENRMQNAAAIALLCIALIATTVMATPPGENEGVDCGLWSCTVVKLDACEKGIFKNQVTDGPGFDIGSDFWGHLRKSGAYDYKNKKCINPGVNTTGCGGIFAQPKGGSNEE